MHFNYRDKIKQAEVDARRHGHITLLPLAVKVMEGILRGTIESSPATQRECAQDVMSRFGLPVKTQLQVDVDLGKKYVELGGYRDEAGVFHPIPWDDAPLAEVVEPPKELNAGHEGNGSGNGAADS